MTGCVGGCASPCARARADPLEAELDRRGMQPLLPLEPIGQVREARTGAASAGSDQGGVRQASAGVRRSGGRPISIASIVAMRSRRSRRSTIMSIAPCSSRNSLRWKPSGSVSRTVCSITRGPAKPISALRLRDVEVAEHREARRHAARRRVGEHRNVRQARLRHAREHGAGLAHLQQRQQAFLHARAAARRKSRRAAARCSRQYSAPRVKRSPTTDPIEPPRNRNSNAQATMSMPVQRAGHDDQRVLLADRLLRDGQPVAVLLAVAELERVFRLDFRSRARDPMPSSRNR